MLEPALEFKIRPTKSSRLYYTVKIFNSITSMQMYAKTGRQKELCYMGTKDYAGLCSTWALEGSNECGEILLCQGYLSPRTVVHEITHAMYGLKRRKQVPDMFIDSSGKIDVSGEEWAVDAVAFMTTTVYNKINTKGKKVGITQ